MTLDWLTEFAAWLLDFAKANADLAVPIAFALGFAESIVLLAWLVPSSVILVAIGGLQQAAGGEFWPPWLAASVGAFLGDMLSFAVGWHYRSEISQFSFLVQRPHWLSRTRAVLDRWGVQGIVASKFFGPLRSFIPIVAGAAHMKWRAFVPASALSCLIWGGVVVIPAYGAVALVR